MTPLGSPPSASIEQLIEDIEAREGWTLLHLDVQFRTKAPHTPWFVLVIVSTLDDPDDRVVCVDADTLDDAVSGVAEILFAADVADGG